MRRREFIVGLGGAAMSQLRPLGAHAQQAATVPVVGYLSSQSPDRAQSHEFRTAFQRGLSETGFVEGRNVAVDYLWAENHNDRLPALAAELARRKVRVIVATNTASAIAAKEATKGIPLVFTIGGDPVELGLVASLNRPGGYITGISQLGADVVTKRLQMLHELVPSASTIAMLVNPTNPQFAAPQTRELQRAAGVLGVQVTILNASSQSEIEAAFATLAQWQTRALLVTAEPLFLNLPAQLVALAARYSVPTIYEFRDFARAGGLMSYGPDIPDAFRQVGIYTGRILKGEKPADLPAQQAAKFEFVINMKTAKALRLTIPLPLLALADEVIE